MKKFDIFGKKLSQEEVIDFAQKLLESIEHLKREIKSLKGEMAELKNKKDYAEEEAYRNHMEHMGM